MFAKSKGKNTDPRLARYDHLIIHCTATDPSMDVDAAWVNRVHIKKGYKGCGYQAVITRSGGWQDHDSGFLARPIGHAGAHVGDCGKGWNGRGFGISLAGGVDAHNRPVNNYTPNQLLALEAGINMFLKLHPTPSTVVLIGHRDLIAMTGAPPKACPCFDVRQWWKELGNYPLAGLDGSRKIAPLERHEDEDSNSKTKSKMLLPDHYVVEKGDSLWLIADRFGVTVSSLRIRNNLVGDTIHPGARLKLK